MHTQRYAVDSWIQDALYASSQWLYRIISCCYSVSEVCMVRVFYSELGTRLNFVKNLGVKQAVGAGPNSISCICVNSHPQIFYKQLEELFATELQMYRYYHTSCPSVRQTVGQSVRLSVGLLIAQTVSQTVCSSVHSIPSYFFCSQFSKIWLSLGLFGDTTSLNS